MDEAALARLCAQIVVLDLVVQLIVARTGCANEVVRNLRIVKAALHSREASNIDPITDQLLVKIENLGPVVD